MCDLSAIRADVMAQAPADRLAYALDLLAYYLDPTPEFFSHCRRLGLDLPAGDLRILHALDRSRGAILTHAAIAEARAFGDDLAEPAPHRVRHYIKAIRAAIRRARLPVSIETAQGLGYRLTAPAGFAFDRVPN